MALKSFSVLAATLALLAPSVSAHGYVSNVNIGGKDYPGFDPNYDLYLPHEDRIVRKIPDDAPVLDTSSDALGCNDKGQMGDGTATANINAGDDIKFTWNTWPTDHHGPVTCYMADCGGDCSKFSVNDAKWFKIDETGYIGPDQNWATDKLIADGTSWTCKIPAALSNGKYLIRHEIVALHTTGEPQYYPSCSQLNVKNGGDGSASGSEAWSTADLYKNANWPDIWGGGDLSKMKVPGPSVVSFSGGGGETNTGNNNSDNSSDDSTPSSSSAASDASPSSPSNSGSCRLKRRNSRRNTQRMKREHVRNRSH